MRITLDMPDDVAQSLARNRPDLSRALLESGTLVGQADELLGTSHNEVDGLLKNAGVYPDYTPEDLDTDRETYHRLGM